MIEPIFFECWQAPLSVIIVGAIAFAVLIVMLRTSGKRTLSKINVFDLVVTVALGSTFAMILLSASVPRFEGILALALLISPQSAITWLSVRSVGFRTWINHEPTLLVHESRYFEAALREQRLTHDEVSAALRASRKTDLTEVGSVVLKTDGSMIVIPRRLTL